MTLSDNANYAISLLLCCLSDKRNKGTDRFRIAQAFAINFKSSLEDGNRIMDSFSAQSKNSVSISRMKLHFSKKREFKNPF